jgi:hypothetical protein
MVKHRLIVPLVVLGTLLLTGCEETKLTYKGKQYPVSQLEEIIENELELENPDYDLDVNVMQDSD